MKMFIDFDKTCTYFEKLLVRFSWAEPDFSLNSSRPSEKTNLKIWKKIKEIFDHNLIAKILGAMASTHVILK